MFFGKRFSGYHGGPFSGLDILVLSIIKNYESTGISGYDIILEINQTFKPMWRASPGTIYPLLGRLEERAFVEAEEIIDENNRQKKIYKITKTGIERLEEVLKDNLESSMNTLGDYIRTVVQTWLPDEKRINRVMTCFPFHCSPHHREIDKEDYSLKNINRLERILKELKFSKRRLVHRLEEIDIEIESYQKVLDNLKNERDQKAKTIPIVGDDEYERGFEKE
ncbi:MAG: PadR family transcriptional regulator [Candidatus Heimdallarchaeota archaeon]